MIKFKIKPDEGEPFDLEATARDVLVWEKTSKTHRTFAQLVRDQSMVDLYRIAHIAARRLGMFTGDLPAFESTCDLEQLEEEESSADPTRPAQ